VTPILSEEAKEVYRDFYVGMRVEGADEDSPVPVTARSLEALHRLGEAKARTRLSNTITAEDAEFVVSLVERSLNDVGVDPESGEYDADIVETGMSKDQREKIQTVLDTVEEIEMQNEMGAPIGEVMQALTEDGFSQSQRENLIKKAKDEGKLYEPSDDHLRRT
jgi:replicative DNA helicase Mcm